VHDLCATVREMGAATEWLDLVQRETGLIFALTRLAAEERKAAREAATTDPTTGEAMA
jgi:hypothetical protein